MIRHESNKVNTMSDEIKLIAGFVMAVFAWVGRLIWVNHTDLQKLRVEHPTWGDLKHEVQQCSDAKDKILKDQQEDLTYIRGRVDKLIDLHMKSED